jgi:uncharacterized pyridoxamine 5'-phosphate oxidase family protein
MSRTVDFLKAAGTFYLATDDDGQPRVRPFGAVMDYCERVYFCTNNRKPVFQQLTANPRVEIAACAAGGDWIRITGSAVVDDSEAARAAMLEAHPGLRRMYSADDGLYEVFYLTDATVTINRRGAEPETYTF